MSRSDTTDICEAVLREEIRYNTQNNILRSENAVAHRLLDRRLELVDAYDEIYRKLHARPNALGSCLKAILYTTAQWNPDKLASARKGRERLEAVNGLISERAKDLAELLHERSKLHNTSRLYSETHYDVCEVIVAASHDNYLFQSYVRKKLESLSGQFDMKYWPSLADFVGILAEDAASATSKASDSMTKVGTQGSRASLADYFKALFKAIEENGVSNNGFLPSDFSLSDSSYAAIGSCALDLSEDEIVEATYVKRLRQRERQAREKVLPTSS
ncbi:hypothetical protein GOZ83_12835 [Agrobacterium vitis]|uniref:hypothetical protein n=1 Tax=Rhizobium/Agrobacterium group TaxID=227290 RepID=UPI0012E8491E|nr:MULTISPECIES: hypothetical protein [Rhizobium/Agrobacterium group]MCF1494445.1 hypothetical protein [Allorhizobium ampelinum]MVA45951.1 hypothetical protein [Agrobacterium vitis]